MLDPGIGRWVPERTSEDDWELCRNFQLFLDFGRPVLAAVSRKTFIGELLGKPPEDRLAGTLALTTMLVAAGAAVVRGHDVPETVIRRRYHRALDNFFRLYREHADRWWLYDNAATDPQRFIAAGGKQGTTHLSRPDLWQNLLETHQ